MSQPDPTFRPGVLTALAATAMAGLSAVTIALPCTTAFADPCHPHRPPPRRPPTAIGRCCAAPAAPLIPTRLHLRRRRRQIPMPQFRPSGSQCAATAPADPNAPVPPRRIPMRPPPRRIPISSSAPADPNAPPRPQPTPTRRRHPLRPPTPAGSNNAAGGFGYVVPGGWEVADASRLSYGQALLLKQSGPGINSQPGPTANDTSILLGRLDLKLFAGAEADNAKSAVRLASDMGEFFMPFPGTRINQQTGPLQAADMPGSFSSYEVKFTDTNKAQRSDLGRRRRHGRR